MNSSHAAAMPPSPPLRKFGLRAALAAGLAAALAGCGGLPSLAFLGGEAEAQGLDRREVRDARRVYLEGLRLISEFHIEPATPAQLVESGFAGLVDIDPQLAVTRADGAIELARGAKRWRWRRPADQAAGEWATIAAEATVAARAASPALAERDPEELRKAVLQTALRRLDPVSRYETPEEARLSRDSREGFGGIGVVIDEADPSRVMQVNEGSPAERAGILAGDRIVAVDGAPTARLDIRAIVRLLRGPEGSTTELEIARAAERGRLLRVRRERIIVQTVRFDWIGPQRDVAYFRVTGFNLGTAEQLRAKVELARAKGFRPSGVVLDLRGNPGGTLRQGVQAASLFLPADRLVVSQRGRHPGSVESYESGGGPHLSEPPMVTLIDGGSASASEVVAAALQDLGRAVVVGSTSFGKGTVQSVHELSNGGEIVLTWARLHAPSGYTIHGLGVHPTICTTLDRPAEAWLADIRANRISAVATAEERRRADALTGPARTAFEQECPKRVRPARRAAGEPDPDLDVALRLLGQPDLIAMALPAARAR